MVTDEDEVERLKSMISESSNELSKAFSELDFAAGCALDEINRVSRRMQRMEELYPDR